MVDLVRDVALAQEAIFEIGLLGDVTVQHLHRDLALQRSVAVQAERHRERRRPLATADDGREDVVHVGGARRAGEHTSGREGQDSRENHEFDRALHIESFLFRLRFVRCFWIDYFSLVAAIPAFPRSQR